VVAPPIGSLLSPLDETAAPSLAAKAADAVDLPSHFFAPQLLGAVGQRLNKAAVATPAVGSAAAGTPKDVLLCMRPPALLTLPLNGRRLVNYASHSTAREFLSEK
jgi:hypothetical protein